MAADFLKGTFTRMCSVHKIVKDHPVLYTATITEIFLGSPMKLFKPCFHPRSLLISNTSCPKDVSTTLHVVHDDVSTLATQLCLMCIF